ncbi:MAG: transporter [Thermoleophilia bacterium]|nr:transporter [Thermoleophilia bacterium]
MTMTPEAPISALVIDDAFRDTITLRERPPQPGPIAVSLTFGWRALLKIKHVPEQLFDVTAFPIMTTLMFTYLFGGALAGSTAQYLDFLLPGILAQTIVLITMYSGMGMRLDIEKGVFDRFRSTPVWQPGVLVGMLLGDLVRYLLASTMVFGLGLILGFRPDGGVLGVLAAIGLVLAFAFSLSWVWLLVGLYARTAQSVMGISMMVLFPLTFISSVFVDPTTMPDPLEWAVDRNPITFLADGSRALMQGDPVGNTVTFVLLSCIGLVAVFGPLTMRRFRTAS